MRSGLLIVGAAKCGTTTLAANLNRHPGIFVVPGEVHYFSKRLAKGPEWYLSRFDRPEVLKGEKSPTYLYFTDCHREIHRLLPEAKLIVMLRHPSERAFSTWNMRRNDKRLITDGMAFNRKHGNRLKSLDFADMVDFYLNHDGEDFLFEKPLDIVHRSLYAPQIESLLRFYPRERLHFIIFEQFIKSELAHYQRVCDFLGMPAVALPGIDKKNVGTYKSRLDAKTRAKLDDYFRPYNEQLYNLLGHELAQWQR